MAAEVQAQKGRAGNSRTGDLGTLLYSTSSLWPLRQGQLLGFKDCLLDENMEFAFLNMFSHT